MVRREGWLDLAKPKGGVKVYARLDGYILSLTKDEMVGSDYFGLIDLRCARGNARTRERTRWLTCVTMLQVLPIAPLDRRLRTNGAF